LNFWDLTTPDSTPPNVKLTPALQKVIKTTSIVDSLGTTIAGIKIQAYTPIVNNPLGAILQGTVGAVNTVTTLILPSVTSLLSPLVDPIINNLLTTLGISLVDVQIGANLTCGQGGRAQLVL